MREQMQLTDFLEKQRNRIILLLNYLKELEPIIYERVIEYIPEETVDMLLNKVIYTDLVDNFVRANRYRLKEILDYRTPEQAVYNYNICLVIEITVEVIFNLLGYNTRRAGGDKDLTDKNSNVLTGTADLQFYWKGKWRNVEVQFGDFKWKNILIKTYKVDNLLRDNNNTGVFILSFNDERKLEFVTFNLRKTIDNKQVTIWENVKSFGGKDLYSIPLNILDIKKINKNNFK